MSTSPKAPRYHHGDLRRALLEAAMEMLRSEGVGGLGLRELARMVGVSPAAPYRHFDSRLALLEALAVTGYQRFTKAVTEATSEGTPAEKLSAMGKAYVRFALDNPDLFGLMFSPELERPARPTLRMAADAAFAPLRAVAGTLPQEDGRIAALRAWALVHGLAVLLLDGQIRLREGETADMLIDGILAG
jgi:AcrR family transcriptional regulator